MLNMGTIRIGAMGITPMGPGGPLGPPVQQQPPPMMNMAMMGQRPPMGGIDEFYRILHLFHQDYSRFTGMICMR